MNLSLDLPPELEEALQLQAERAGQDVATLVLEAVREKIARSEGFDDVCAPFAQAVTTSGMGDEEFERFFDEVREEAWLERQGKPK